MGHAGQAVLGVPRRWPCRLGAHEAFGLLYRSKGRQELLALLEMAADGPPGQASGALEFGASTASVGSEPFVLSSRLLCLRLRAIATALGVGHTLAVGDMEGPAAREPHFVDLSQEYFEDLALRRNYSPGPQGVGPRSRKIG